MVDRHLRHLFVAQQGRQQVDQAAGTEKILDQLPAAGGSARRDRNR
jgi:hypothetical protein